MKVLVVGGGGREHTLVWKLAQSPRVAELYCAPGNGGIAKLAQCVPIRATDIPAMVRFAKEQAIDFVVVAPDDPLSLGMVDALETEGIPAFGPKKNAARIESSKAFSKALMKKYGIPTASYEEFSDPDAADSYLARCPYPIVVKADGLALGKGVLICETEEQAHRAVEDIMRKKVFGAAGDKIIVEEFMTGPEVSILAFVDGERFVPMVSAQDHKRALDGDRGLNTGGMGTFAPSPKYTPEVAAFVEKHIMAPTVAAMAQEGCPFRGVLYFGLMLTESGPKVLEYNARFGDPETQVVLPLLESDLLPILEQTAAGTLDPSIVRWKKGAAVCVVLASGGYPEKYQTGKEIFGLNALKDAGLLCFHAGTKAEGEKLLTAGGRVLGVTAVADTMDEAIQKAYAGVSLVSFEGMHYRTDIGRK